MSGPFFMGLAAQQVLHRELARIQPRTIACHGAMAIAWVSDARLNATLSPQNPFLTPFSDKKFDVAVVSDICAKPASEVEAMLARSRDLLSHHVFVITEHSCETVSSAALISLGFSRVPSDDPHFALFGFHIDTYKDIPDWLNDRYWAHPENWGKFRW